MLEKENLTPFQIQLLLYYLSLIHIYRLSTVAGADRIYVVKDGQIAESGSSRELMERRGLFAGMWQNYQTSVQWKVQKEVQ